jgi:hypothetical protein
MVKRVNKQITFIYSSIKFASKHSKQISRSIRRWPGSPSPKWAKGDSNKHLSLYRRWPLEENRKGLLFRKSPIYEVMSKKHGRFRLRTLFNENLNFQGFTFFS